MKKRFARLREEWNLPGDKLIAIHGGVDSATKHMGMNSRVGGLGSIASEADGATGEVSFWALDDLLPEGCTFLKADIESFEYRMLCGAIKPQNREDVDWSRDEIISAGYSPCGRCKP